MGNKIIITENQYQRLKSYINESGIHQKMVELMASDLNANYEPMIGVVREDDEYHDVPMIKIKIDESEITPRELFEYFKKKYKFGDDFIKQVIQDWAFGNIKDGMLTKNVPIN
jgi:hypothetical protein